MDPNRKPTPEGKITMVAGIVVLCFELINIALMVIRNNLMLGQIIASGLLMCLAIYYIFVGKQKWDQWKKDNGEE